MKKKLMGRGFTLGALSLALAAAVYLNWNFAQDIPQTVSSTVDEDTVAVSLTGEGAALETAAEPSGELAEPVSAEAAVQDEAAAVYDPLEISATAVSGEETSTETANKNYGEAQLVSASKDSGSEFFESARLTRTKTRDEALDTLKKALKSTDLTKEEKAALTEKLEAQVGNITVESGLETVIKSKGFADCVVMVEGEKVNVTVMTENDALTAAEVTRIRDAILTRMSGMTAQNITIVEVK